MIDVVERDGRVYHRSGNVAVLYSPGFGAGWYSWNEDFPECLFDPVVVDWVLNGRDPTDSKLEVLEKYLRQAYSEDFYPGGLDTLTIYWMTPGTFFRVEEYDGNEHIELKGEIEFLVA